MQRIIPVKDLIDGLLACGWTQASIARELKTSQPTICRLSSGKQVPRLETYDRLLALAEREAGKFKDLRDRLLQLLEDV